MRGGKKLTEGARGRGENGDTLSFPDGVKLRPYDLIFS